jgi:hypothetical protein
LNVFELENFLMGTVTTQIRYAFDPTGQNTDNFVDSEAHTLPVRRVRALAPKYGPFYGKTVKLVEASTGRVLTYGTHYSLGELLPTATQKVGQGIYSIIVVTDAAVLSDILVSYQTIGGDFSYSPEALISMLTMRLNPATNTVNWADVIGKPDQYIPAKHLHDVGDVFGFEYVVEAINRVKEALLWARTPMYDALLNWITDQLSHIDQRFNNLLNAQLGLATQSLLAQMNKANIGLGNVDNLSSATSADGVAVADVANKASSLTTDKFMTLSGMFGFRDKLLSEVTRVDTTGLGAFAPNQLAVTRASLANLPTGATGLTLSVNYCKQNGVLYEQQQLPPIATGTSTYFFFKLNNVTNNSGGGAYIFIDQGTLQTFIGFTSNATSWMTWKQVALITDLQGVVDSVSSAFQDHVKDIYNPHKVTSDQVGLGLTPNYLPADVTDVNLRRNVKKLVTMDMLNAYAKLFLQPLNSSSTTTNSDGSTTVTYKPTVRMIDSAGAVYGYLFGSTDTAPAAATVAFKDVSGTLIGYAYPTADTNATQAIRDANGTIVGYIPTVNSYTVTIPAANTVTIANDVVVSQPYVASGTAVSITMYLNGLTPGAVYKITPVLTTPAGKTGHYQLNGADVVLTTTADTAGSGTVQFAFPTAGLAVGTWMIAAIATTTNETINVSSAGGMLVIT